MVYASWFLYLSQSAIHINTHKHKVKPFSDILLAITKKPSHNKSFLNTAAQERVEIVHIFHKNHPSGYLLLVPHKKKNFCDLNTFKNCTPFFELLGTLKKWFFHSLEQAFRWPQKTQLLLCTYWPHRTLLNWIELISDKAYQVAVLNIVAHVEKRWGTRKGAEEDKKRGSFMKCVS